jgi:citrate synthase
MKRMVHVLLEKLHLSDPLLDVALELEEIARKDDYFIEHHLYPNVDFYSGIALRAIGIPTSMFTVMFAIRQLRGGSPSGRSMDDPDWSSAGRARSTSAGGAPARRSRALTTSAGC